MCPFLANFDRSVMLAVGDVAVNSCNQPSYILVRLKRSKNDPFGQGVTVYVGRSTKSCVQSQQCWLTWRFAVQLQAHSLFLRMVEYCLGSSWSLNSQLHCRKSGLTPHHTRVTASVLEQPLQQLRLG